MMGMHLPLSIRKGRQEGIAGQGRVRGEGVKDKVSKAQVGVRYLTWLHQDLQDKRLGAAVPTAW